MKLTRIILFLYFTLIYSQIGIQVTQTSNFASGDQLNLPFPIDNDSTTAYIINENLFDISTTYKNFYLYTQLEYSDPPVFGETRTTVDKILNTYYLEYLGEKLNIKLGDIHSLYTRGLMFNTYQEQSTDFNNSISGIELSFLVKDWLRIYSIYGTDTYEFRTRPVNQFNDLSFDHTSTFLGTQINLISDIILNLQYLNQSVNISESVTAEGGASIIEHYSFLYTVLGHDIAENISDFDSDNIDNYQINANMLGLSLQGDLLGLDFYGEYASNKYTKLQPYTRIGEEVDGSLFYGSLFADILGNGVTYEFKRYDMPYFIPTLSFGPIVYKEPTSILQSRNSHNMNFVNEIGHQLDVIHLLSDNIDLTFNISIARRIHPFDGQINTIINSFDSTAFDSNVLTNGLYAALENINNESWESTSSTQNYSYSNPNNMSILFMDKDEEVLSFWPYRQFYAGINGYLLDDRLYFSIGYDLFDHIKQWGGDEFGMIHNNYVYSGFESAEPIISDYWLGIQSDFTDEFNVWTNYYGSSYAFDKTCETHNCSSWEDILDFTFEYETDQEGNPDFSPFFDSLAVYYQSVALDSIDSSMSSNSYKWHYDSEKATTIPMQFAWNIGNGSSVLLYVEQQWREKKKNQDITYYSGESNQEGSNLEKANEQYLSVSYKDKKYGTFTLFFNQEKNTKTAFDFDLNADSKDVKTKQWNGLQWTYDFKINNNSHKLNRYLLGNSTLSIFYGSQRGGLICANGICAVQPEFLNGAKFSYIRIF